MDSQGRFPAAIKHIGAEPSEAGVAAIAAHAASEADLLLEP